MKTSILESELLDKGSDELKEIALSLYQRQRELREQKRNDPKIIEHQTYLREMYNEPNSDIEKRIKIIRRVFKLKGIILKEEEINDIEA